MVDRITYTHKGWFGICPIYLAGLEYGEPIVEARHWSLEWLFDLSAALYAGIMTLRSGLDPLYEPEWPFMVTSELNPPKTKAVKDE